ncbi:glycosyltransferase family 4 protein [Dichotomicrobium thermohalophilum]|uniref:glycosyltransferase family 4 protein n=1 Tax=Dichotomicrobium thermohalophilum TaxID=933063 RepID=UPI001FDF4865|nr:glycosyltransferase family 4 protein [Dichotomicrobium thermohalophilum]
MPELDTGGAEASAIEMVEAVTRTGGRCLVASQGGRLEETLARAGGELCPLPLATKNPVRMAANIAALRGLIRARGVDLVHARSRAPAWSALAAARLAGVPFVTTYHGAYNQKSRAKSFYNSVMARGDVVIANSRYTADLLMRRHGTQPEQVRVIYRGVDVERFAPDAVSPERVAALRAAWGVAPETRIVLQVARLTRWKGQDIVIAAAARVLKQADMGDVAVVLAGDAQGRHEYERQLRELIAANGLDGRIKLVGHVSDVPAACRAAEIVVVASREAEAFGRASAEAQAAEKPVIVAERGALPETLVPMRCSGDEGTGWLVAPDDPDALAACLENALRLPPETLARIGARGRAHVTARFTTQAMQSATLDVYDTLLGSRLAETFRDETSSNPLQPCEHVSKDTPAFT